MTVSALYRFIVSAICSILITSCAQIVAPSGGAKDTTPPVVVKESPENKSNYFSETKISIKFDEFIQLKDADEQIVISPPADPKPVFEVSGKTIHILLRNKLKPNTTYTINFGNSIVDNHESNIFSNYHYVFTTGEYLDSLDIKGAITNGFTSIPEKGFLVCLYPVDSFNDSTILKQKPVYFSKSDANGQFSIENLAPQDYRLVAFKDDNRNLIYDKNEAIAFENQIVRSTDTLLIQLFSFKPNKYPINKLIDTIAKEPGKFQFVIYKPYKALITPIQTNTYYNWFKEGTESLDTITIFSNNLTSDSVEFIHQTPIELNQFYLKHAQSAKQKRFEATLVKTLELNDSFTIKFNQPIDTFIYDTSHFQLKEDTILIEPTIFISDNKDCIKLYYPLKEGIKYSIELKDSAIRSIYGGYNKKDKQTYSTKKLKDYSTLILDIIHPNNQEQYIIQMLTPDEKEIFKTFILNSTQTIELNYLNPATYKIKIIKDHNKNGQWDNGDYQLLQQPERVYYYKESITLRAFWDLQQTINLNEIVD